MLDKIGVIFVGKLYHILRNRLVSNVLSEVIVVNFRVHIDKVNNSPECVLRADRQLNRNTVAVETLLNHIKNVVEIRTHNIHLIDVYHSRYVVFVSLTPNGFRLRLNTALCAQNGYRAVKHAERTLNFNGEVNVSGSVDNIDTMVFPEASSSSGGDCNTSFLLLLHPVHS